MASEKRLIDVEQAKRAAYEEVFWSESEQAVVRNFLAKLPKVSAVEVVHGRWIRRHNETKCSRCKFIYYSNHDDFNYCPNCGAKMDGGNEDGCTWGNAKENGERREGE